MALYNTWDGRQEWIYSATHTLKNTNVNITMVQEVKHLDPKSATRNWVGYNIRAAAVGSSPVGALSS